MKFAIALGLCLTALVGVVFANNGHSTQTTTPGFTSTTTSNGDRTSTTTVTGTSNGTTTNGASTNGTTTNGTTTPSASVATTAAPTVLNVVEITQNVPAGTAAVTAFTVPAGQTLIITDVLVTNTSTAATCGGAVNRAAGVAAGGASTTTAAPPATGATPTTGETPTTGAAATPTVGVTAAGGTITQTDSTVTGPLCIAPRTTTALPLTTGIEFGSGQTVQLMNTPDPTAAAGVTPPAVSSGLAFHLRGLLVAS